MSEFGRRADENGSAGTDHGHGNVMFAMGGSIAGGQVHSNWTGGELLHPDLLYGGDSLQVTTDYRNVVAEIVQNRLGNTNLSEIFLERSPIAIGDAKNHWIDANPVDRNSRVGNMDELAR